MQMLQQIPGPMEDCLGNHIIHKFNNSHMYYMDIFFI